MGLHISSINGLRGVSGYELYVLTYGLAPYSPEFRVVQENFSFIADLLGSDGIVITGTYDKEFGGNFAGYLAEIEDKLFSTSILVSRLTNADVLPVPALAVILRKESDDPQLAYISILNKTSEFIVSTFRNIAKAGEKGDLALLENDSLAQQNASARALWDSIQLRPSFWGVGMDVKVLVERLRKRQ